MKHSVASSGSRGARHRTPSSQRRGSSPPSGPNPKPAEKAVLEEGARLGRYLIREELGRGGMGAVYRAVRPDRPGAEYALKVVIGGPKASAREVRRLLSEATIMAPLQHPGISAITEVGRHDGTDFIAMKLIEGVSLRDLGAGRSLSTVDALELIRSTAKAVDFMHSQGIFHRDIKPSNIMVRPDGQPVLVDFGLAGWDPKEVPTTRRGAIGTPAYQPPEQTWIGGPFGDISTASDVYGLGATLYFLLTGKPPFRGRDVARMRVKVRTMTPTPVRELNAAIDPAVEALCMRCLRKRPEARIPTANILIAEIDRLLARMRTRESKGNAKPRRSRRRRRRKAKRASTGFTTLLAAPTVAVGMLLVMFMLG